MSLLPRSQRTTQVALGALMAVCSVGTAHADNEAVARALFDEGKRLSHAGSFAAACPKFRQSLDLSGKASAEFRLAACEEQLGHTATAWTHFRGAAKRATAAGETAGATESTTRGDALEKRLVRLQIDVPRPVPGLEVRREQDVVSQAEWGVPIPVDPGTLHVSATAPSKKRWETTVPATTEGKTIKLEIPALVDGEPTPVAAVPVDRAAAAGRLTVTAGEGDTISVDGKTVGVSRFEGTLPPGTHSVHVTADGKEAYDADVDLAAGGSKTVWVTLKSVSSGGIPTWAWIAGGVVVAGGLGVGGYFLFKPKDEQPGSSPTGKLDTFMLKGFRGVRF